RVTVYPVLIDDKPEPRTIGYPDHSLGIDGDRLTEHLVATGECKPAGRIMGELEKRAISNRGGKMEIGKQPNSVAPGVRRKFEMRRLGHGRDLAKLEDALGEKGIRLQDIVTAPLYQQLELVQPVIVLTPAELDHSKPLVAP